MQLVNNQSYNKNFTARNPEIRKADALCRLVNKEFPFFSNTKIDEFLPNDKAREKFASNYRLLKYRDFVSEGVSVLREYYGYESKYNKRIFKVLNGVRTAKFANCGEMAEVTKTVLEINGVKNVRTCELYAIDKKTKKIRDLDHTVVIQDLKIPKNFSYIYGDDLIKPEAKNIIIDSWAGFADYSNNAFQKYKNKPYFEQPLKEDEEIMIFPHSKKKLSKKDIQFIKQTYPSLVISQEEIIYDEKLAIKNFIEPFPEGQMKNAKKTANLNSSINCLPMQPKKKNLFDKLMYWATKFSEVFDPFGKL